MARSSWRFARRICSLISAIRALISSRRVSSPPSYNHHVSIDGSEHTKQLRTSHELSLRLPGFVFFPTAASVHTTKRKHSLIQPTPWHSLHCPNLVGYLMCGAIHHLQPNTVAGQAPANTPLSVARVRGRGCCQQQCWVCRTPSATTVTLARVRSMVLSVCTYTSCCMSDRFRLESPPNDPRGLPPSAAPLRQDLLEVARSDVHHTVDRSK